MSFLSSILDKSVFTKESISKAIYGRGLEDKSPEGYAIVKIEPNIEHGRQDMAIVGVLQEGNVSISLRADWDKIGGAAALTNIPLLNTFIDIGGITDSLIDSANVALNPNGLVLGKAMASRKVFRGEGGYLEIPVKIRIVDWNGSGQPIVAGALLAQYCLPTDAKLSKDAQDYWKKIKDGIMHNQVTKFVVDKVSDLVEGAKEITSTTTDAVAGKGTAAALGAGTGEVVNAAGDTLKQHFDGFLSSFDLKSSPTPVTLTIGEFFKHNDMVIESVQLDFSKEVTEAGPLFLDATIQLSSRYIINDISNVGFKTVDKKSRVSFTGASLTGI